MVSLKLSHRLTHFISLALLKHLSSLSLSPSPSPSISYLTPTHLKAINQMQLLTRGRLSVQAVEETVWDAVNLMGERGGWEGLEFGKGRGRKAVKNEESEEKKEHGMAAKERARKRKFTDVEKLDESENENENGNGRRKSTRRKT